jgi:hypothetical protein
MLKLKKNGLILASVTSFLFACTATQTADPIVSNSDAAPPKLIKAAETVTSSIQSKLLTLEMIMADPDWMGRQPTSAYWGDDSQSVYYQQKQIASPILDLWEKPINEKGKGNKVELTQLHLHDYNSRILNQTKDLAAWVFEGNIFVKSLPNNKVKQLTKDNKQPNNLVFLNDGRLSFQSGDAIYAIHPEHGLYEQLVSWQFADEPSQRIILPSSSSN